MDGDADLEVLVGVTAQFVTACRNVGPDHLAAATPCPDWDAAALIDHVTGGNRFTVRVLGGGDADAALAYAFASFDELHDPPTAGIESAHRQLAAFHGTGALERRCSHVAGQLTGRQVLRLRLHDLIIHTWDLNQVLDPRTPIDAAHVRWAIDELRSRDSLAATHFATSLSERAASEADLLEAFGRR